MVLKSIATLTVVGLMLATAWGADIPAETPTEPRDGNPPAGATLSVVDLDSQVKYQRAFEAVIWSMPLIAKAGLRRGSAAIGAGPNVVLAMSAGATPLFEALTPNHTTPYVLATTDLRYGPVVLEVPVANDKASLFGQVADNRYITIADIGPIGVDKGKGGKILLTPPGYAGDVPQGYIEVKSPSLILDFAFRSISSPQGSDADAYALSKQLKLYYLSELPNPSPTRFVDPIDTQWSTLARYDDRWFDDLNEVIQIEPVLERDKAMMGMLKTLGIEKGKPFNPDEKTRKIMRQAVVDAYFYIQQRFLTVEPDDLWWPDRRWRDAFYSDSSKGFSWDLDSILDYDNRAVHPWFTAIYFPAKVAPKPATMYLATARDGNGDLFEAGKTYSLTVPKDVPVNKFWSLTIYDRDTWAFIYSPEMRPGLSSRELDQMNKNADGSVTLYFGPKAPDGLESNWIPTSGKAVYAMFRFYGPEDAFYDKSFKLADVKPVE